MIEYEKKILLSALEYKILMVHFDIFQPSIKQINYYYDTPDFDMNRQGITCRLRYKDGRYRATLKAHADSTRDESLEIIIPNSVDITHNGFVNMGLQYHGCLTTERFLLTQMKGCEAVLDKNEYLGMVDYELEVEYLDGHEKSAGDILNYIIEIIIENIKENSMEDLVERTKKSKSKSQRFFERLSNYEDSHQ